MCSNYPRIKLEPALRRKEDKIEHFSSDAHVVYPTTKLVISRRRKNESVCEMSKNEKCSCKACETIVKYKNLSRSVCRRFRNYLSALIKKRRLLGALNFQFVTHRDFVIKQCQKLLTA